MFDITWSESLFLHIILSLSYIPLCMITAPGFQKALWYLECKKLILFLSSCRSSTCWHSCNHKACSSLIFVNVFFEHRDLLYQKTYKAKLQNLISMGSQQSWSMAVLWLLQSQVVQIHQTQVLCLGLVL